MRSNVTRALVYRFWILRRGLGEATPTMSFAEERHERFFFRRQFVALNHVPGSVNMTLVWAGREESRRVHSFSAE